MGAAICMKLSCLYMYACVCACMCACAWGTPQRPQQSLTPSTHPHSQGGTPEISQKSIKIE